jgi:hypothetical protein
MGRIFIHCDLKIVWRQQTNVWQKREEREKLEDRRGKMRKEGRWERGKLVERWERQDGGKMEREKMGGKRRWRKGEREKRDRRREIKKIKTDYLQVIEVIFVDNACCNSGKHPIDSCFAMSCK